MPAALSAPTSRIPARRAAVREKIARWSPGVPAALLLYALLRAAGLLTLGAYAAAQHRGVSPWHALIRFDAAWYAQIAAHGYDTALRIGPHGVPATTNLAFFPLYPGLVALVHLVLPVAAAGVVVSWAAGLGAAWGLYALGAHLRDARTGVLLAGLWAVVPHAVVESMGYSETLFTALAAWSLLAVLRRQWLTAGILCLLAGLTRPTSAALVAAVGLAALVAVCREPRAWRAWCAMVLAPLGLLGFVGWVGVVLGRADGYFYVQNVAWRMRFDGGGDTVRKLGTVATHAVPLAYVVTTAVLVIGLTLLVIGIGERLPWPLLVYAAGVLAVVLGGAGYYWAKGRLLLPDFPLLIPIAYALARARGRTTPIAVITLLAVLSAFYGVYLCLIWKSSP